MNFIFSLLILCAQTVFAFQDQKLGNGQWAYYGEDFYLELAKSQVNTSQIHKILDEKHSAASGQFDTISNKCKSNCYQHTAVGYDKARKIMFGELDILKDKEGTYVLDVYCGKKFYFKTIDEVSSMHNLVNIEHTWPQSKFTGSFPKEVQKSDMHHLFLTDSMANSTRGNSPFGFIDSSENREGGEGCRDSRFGLIDGKETYTPPAPHRGNVARALFYFSIRYNLPISSSEEMILRKWHQADPVDEEEIKRHERIAAYQKNRNPFVDHPELVSKVIDF